MAVADVFHSNRYYHPVIILIIGKRLHDIVRKVKKPQSRGNIMGITELSS
jgi:hypothetical protein